MTAIPQRTQVSVRVQRLCDGRGRWPRSTVVFCGKALGLLQLVQCGVRCASPITGVVGFPVCGAVIGRKFWHDDGELRSPLLYSHLNCSLSSSSTQSGRIAGGCGRPTAQCSRTPLPMRVSGAIAPETLCHGTTRSWLSGLVPTLSSPVELRRRGAPHQLPWALWRCNMVALELQPLTGRMPLTKPSRRRCLTAVRSIFLFCF
jgi:hypothetical protein